jgi:hypothetical protein
MHAYKNFFHRERQENSMKLFNTNEMKLTSDLLDKINKLQESSTESPKQGQQQKVPTLSDISAVTL